MYVGYIQCHRLCKWLEIVPEGVCLCPVIPIYDIYLDNIHTHKNEIHVNRFRERTSRTKMSWDTWKSWGLQ